MINPNLNKQIKKLFEFQPCHVRREETVSWLWHCALDCENACRNNCLLEKHWCQFSQLTCSFLWQKELSSSYLEARADQRKIRLRIKRIKRNTFYFDECINNCFNVYGDVERCFHRWRIFSWRVGSVSMWNEQQKQKWSQFLASGWFWVHTYVFFMLSQSCADRGWSPQATASWPLQLHPIPPARFATGTDLLCQFWAL